MLFLQTFLYELLLSLLPTFDELLDAKHVLGERKELLSSYSIHKTSLRDALGRLRIAAQH